MKSIFKTMIGGLMAVCALVSCVDDAVEPLTGKYTEPVLYDFDAVVSHSEEKQENRRLFAVQFTNAEGGELSVTFVGDTYYLHTAAFTAAVDTAAKKGNYILGKEYTSFKKSDTDASVAVENGTLNVTKDGDNYTVNGFLWLADADVVEVNCVGTIVYEPDPEPMALVNLLSATNNLPNGTNTVTVQFATSDVACSYDPATWSMVYTGTGNYLAIDFYSTDGTLQPGTYTPADAASASAGNYVKGYDTTVDWGWGPMEMKNWGTCWWTVDDGATSGVHVETGDIVVEKNGTAYTITLNNGEVFAQYKGKIETLDPDGGELVPVVMERVHSASSNNGTFTLKLAKGDFTVTQPDYTTTFEEQYAGEGNILSLDILTASGTLEPGVFTIADHESATVGQFVAGYDTTVDWGWGPMEMTNWGSCWFTVEAPKLAGAHIAAGTVTIEAADAGYAVTFEGALEDGTEMKVVYTGAIEL